MRLLKAERIKLLSTRTPWFCTVLAIVASIGFTMLFIGLTSDDQTLDVGSTQEATSFGRTVILVLAVVAAAGDFNWGTMRVTFQAAPTRVPALLAKALVVGGWSALVGLVTGFGCWTASMLLQPDAHLALSTATDWREVAGQAWVYFFTGVLGVGVGILLRSTALAVALTLVWTQLVEGLVLLIPHAGPHIYEWLPGFAAAQFVGGTFGVAQLHLPSLPLSAVLYGIYFAGIAAVLFAAGVLLNLHRDTR